MGTYADREVSGYRRDRQGLMQLLADTRDGYIDIIVCEARDGEDISWLGKTLRLDSVRLFTSFEGEINEIKLAVAAVLGFDVPVKPATQDPMRH